MPKLLAPGKEDIQLAAITPNYAAEEAYKRALARAVASMAASYQWWVDRTYEKALEANVDAGRLPDLAMDAAGTPGGAQGDMFGELARLKKYWSKYFDDFAKSVATRAITDFYEANTRGWTSRLRTAGFDLKLELTPSQKLIFGVKVKENVALIKSIHSDYHGEIEGIVARNYLGGRDLATMAEQIKARGKVTTNRAALIAKDQSNKACAQMNSARQRELGIKYAVWIHSSAGKEPREKHVRAGREQWVFLIGQGIDFHDKFGHVLPGEAINCKCTSRSIIPALGRGDIGSMDDLEPVPGYPGAYRAKKGKTAGPKMKNDVEKTRSPAGSPVVYS
jgi:hypothetical protein